MSVQGAEMSCSSSQGISHLEERENMYLSSHNARLTLVNTTGMLR